MINHLLNNPSFYLQLIKEHLIITFISSLFAFIIGLVLGILISRLKKLAPIIINLVNIFYTIPSIALLGLFISITGIGNTTAIIALTIYGLLPIVRSTYTSIISIDSKYLEVADAMGSSNFDRLMKVELPLALPYIFTALRNMVTMTIALAGIASFVGAGGLGVAIYRGITTNNKLLILNGSLLIALLALIIDFILGMIEKRIQRYRHFSKKILLVVLVIILIGGLFYHNQKSTKQLSLASKPTTEGYILAYLVKGAIEANTDLNVKLTLGVGGGTANIHPALLKGDFDMYPEYTGTAWQVVLKNKSIYNESRFKQLKSQYEKKYQLTWTSMFGFNDTYSLAMLKKQANKYHIQTFSDLKKYPNQFLFGAEYDFFEREDGYEALKNAYQIKFKETVDMDNGLKYDALLKNKLDIMTVFTTDGRLSNPNIFTLKDDLSFYPSYQAGMVIKQSVLNKYPELNQVFKLTSQILNEKQMAKLNYQVEVNKQKPEKVAYTYLKEKGVMK